ncbi:YybS family protein [Robertmurraya massiliosenegalensis]|uniref:YybS family protein n=1 Tax=Robertmurraya massiliosenegalensis TaxID=1287657 RepID=UPI0002F89ECD|nr:YybS family protein [Robertmurraya massiliosenegalensis]
MKNAHKLTEGALYLAIFAVLLLITIYIPVLGVVVNLFIALPFIMFSAKHDRKSAFVVLIGAILISLIVGTVMAIPLALTYGLTGIVIGDFIREKKSWIAGFIAGSMAFLLTLVIQYVISVVFLEMDVIQETIQLFESSISQAFDMLQALGQTPDARLIEQFETSVEMLKILVPSIFVMVSFMIVFITELISFPIAKRFGVEIPKWITFRDLKLPKSLLWYYLIVLLVSLMLNPEQGTFLYTASMNLSFILQFFMVIQGLAFIFYFSHVKEMPKFIPILVAVFTFIFPILLYIVRILGIIDLGFDLRKRVAEKK